MRHATAQCGVIFAKEKDRSPELFRLRAGGTLIATYPNQIVIDDGEWLACVTCEALAEFKDWSHLLDRTVIGTLARFPQLPDTDDTRRVLREKQAFLLSLVFDQKVSA